MSEKCNFCGKEIKDELNFTGDEGDDGQTVRICASCIEKCNTHIKEYESKNKKRLKTIDQTPDTIKTRLDEWVIGQEEAKKTIATEVYNHLKRIKRLENNPNANKKLRIDKSNIIMVGPTGTGKTEIIRALGEILDVPYTIQNATSFTATGLIFS